MAFSEIEQAGGGGGGKLEDCISGAAGVSSTYNVQSPLTRLPHVFLNGRVIILISRYVCACTPLFYQPCCSYYTIAYLYAMTHAEYDTLAPQETRLLCLHVEYTSRTVTNNLNLKRVVFT